MEKLEAAFGKKALSYAYIAGFFDGDGSVRLQLQPRHNSKLGYRVRAIISIAQKTGHEKGLKWIRSKFGIGYIYSRNDGMSELRIEGFKRVENILTKLAPFVHFKKKQVNLVLKALKILKENPKDILSVAKISDRISGVNYATTKKIHTAKAVEESINKIYPRND